MYCRFMTLYFNYKNKINYENIHRKSKRNYTSGHLHE